jgi:hypothetical protein
MNMGPDRFMLVTGESPKEVAEKVKDIVGSGEVWKLSQYHEQENWEGKPIVDMHGGKYGLILARQEPEQVDKSWWSRLKRWWGGGCQHEWTRIRYSNYFKEYPPQRFLCMKCGRGRIVETPMSREPWRDW